MSGLTHILKEIEKKFTAFSDPDFAVWSYAYMRKQFPFLGVRQPQRKILQKPFLKKLYALGEPSIKQLWAQDHREYQYVAMDVLSSGPLREESLPLFEKLITQKSWWDTVDVLASNHLGKFFKTFPSYIKETERWMTHPNLWLRRSALLFQLRYKNETDEERLFFYCTRLAKEKEFFIQRAIAWALREYAKTSPKSIKTLLKKVSFSNCVRKEVSS